MGNDQKANQTTSKAKSEGGSGAAPSNATVRYITHHGRGSAVREGNEQMGGWSVLEIKQRKDRTSYRD